MYTHAATYVRLIGIGLCALMANNIIKLLRIFVKMRSIVHGCPVTIWPFNHFNFDCWKFQFWKMKSFFRAVSLLTRVYIARTCNIFFISVIRWASLDLFFSILRVKLLIITCSLRMLGQNINDGCVIERRERHNRNSRVCTAKSLTSERARGIDRQIKSPLELIEPHTLLKTVLTAFEWYYIPSW